MARKGHIVKIFVCETEAMTEGIKHIQDPYGDLRSVGFRSTTTLLPSFLCYSMILQFRKSKKSQIAKNNSCIPGKDVVY